MSDVVLIVSDLNFGRPYVGNRQRIFSLAVALRNLGKFVVLIAPKTQGNFSFEEFFNIIITVDLNLDKNHRVESQLKSEFVLAIEIAMKKYEPIAMIAEYAWMAQYLQLANKNCMKIIDTHDVLHLRRSSFEDAGFNKNSKWTLQSELRLLNFADVLLGIQEKECQFFKDHLGETPKVLLLPHGVPLSDNFQYMPSDGAIISFIGTRQKGNFGILEFLEFCWPKILEQVPSCDLRIFGSIGNEIPESKKRFVKGISSSLDEVYLNSTVIIAPILAGSGLKIKIVEAMRHGRAVVSTQKGVEGLINLGDCPCISTNDWKEFGDAIVELILDETLRHYLEELCFDYSNEFYSISKMENTLYSLFQ